MKDWELTQKEIDKLWSKYEEENPDQGGLDTWDKRLIKAAQKKLMEWMNNPKHAQYKGRPCIIGVFNPKEWYEICKGVGL